MQNQEALSKHAKIIQESILEAKDVYKEVSKFLESRQTVNDQSVTDLMDDSSSAISDSYYGQLETLKNSLKWVHLQDDMTICRIQGSISDEILPDQTE